MTLPGDHRLRVLVSQLQRHRPADPAESVHRGAMLALSETAAPFSADQYQPGHFTASGLVISATANRVLLIRHPTLGRWLQPGGHVDPEDATVLDAALREVREETGLAPDFDPTPADLDVHRIPARGTRAEHWHYDVRFIGTLAGLPEIGGGEGIAGEWCDLATALDRAGDSGLARLLSKAAGAGLLR